MLLDQASRYAAAADNSTSWWLPLAPAAVAAVASIIAAVVAAFAAARARRNEAQATRMLDLERRNSERKLQTYEPMIELLRDMLDPQTVKALAGNEGELRDEIGKFASWIAIFGSDEAITYFQRFMQCTYSGAPVKILMRMYAEFILAAWRDMGNPDTRINPAHILGIRINDMYSGDMAATLSVPLHELYSREKWTPPWIAEERAAVRRNH